MDLRRLRRSFAATIFLLTTLISLLNLHSLPSKGPALPAERQERRQNESPPQPRRLTSSSSGAASMKLRVVHSRAADFRSMAEEIESLVKQDLVRMKEFGAKIGGARRRSAVFEPSLAASAPEPAAAPPQVVDFAGRVVSGALFPGNVGQYFVEFSVGTPAQPFFFIIDTGSDLLWVPCTLLRNCSGGGGGGGGGGCSSAAIFRAEHSSSFTPIACTAAECELIPAPIDAPSCTAAAPSACSYAYRYSDSSQTTGVFGYDTVTMHAMAAAKASIDGGSSPESAPIKSGAASAPPPVAESVLIGGVALGCGTNNTGPSITKIGGVLGLGQGPISFATQVGYLYGNVFSYCFTSFFSRRNASSSLRFGRRTPQSPPLRAALQSTPFVSNRWADTFYYIGVESVKVDGIDVGVPADVWKLAADGGGGGGALIDSGTTLTFIATPAYDLISAAIDRSMKLLSYEAAPPAAGLSLCYANSSSAQRRLPKLAIVLSGGAVFAPPPHNYFLRPQPSLLCLALIGAAAPDSPTVLGNLLQQNMYIEYDRSKMRLSFARAYCAEEAA